MTVVVAFECAKYGLNENVFQWLPIEPWSKRTHHTFKARILPLVRTGGKTNTRHYLNLSFIKLLTSSKVFT